MKQMPAGKNRLFAMVDPRSRHAIGYCAGPGPSGECPSFVAGQPLPCEGYRLVPQHGTSVDGLPFLVEPGSGSRCPLAWVDDAEGEALVQDRDREGWGPPWAAGPPAPGSVPPAL